MKYVDAKGKEQRPVRCAVLRGGDDHIIGNGWYAVTGNISYASGMIVWGETNLILCDGATLTDTDGIWVQDSARLTVWAQSNDEKTRGRLIVQGGQNKAGIGGIEDEKAGTIVINGTNVTISTQRAALQLRASAAVETW